VLQRGNVLVRDGAFHGRQGEGRFLERSRFGTGSKGGGQGEPAAVGPA
jgi:hypothetical protein